MRFALCAAFAAALSIAVSAQIPGAARRGAQDFEPAQVAKDGTITFRMYCPGAKEVAVVGEIVTVSGRPSKGNGRAGWAITPGRSGA